MPLLRIQLYQFHPLEIQLLYQHVAIQAFYSTSLASLYIYTWVPSVCSRGVIENEDTGEILTDCH